MNKWYSCFDLKCCHLVVLSLLLGMAARGQTVSQALVEEYVFLIDTSASMVQNRLVGPLRVALNDFTDTVPTDGSSRIWIFTFDQGLGKQVIEKRIAGSHDLQEVKVFLMERTFTGRATFIHRSLDGVLDRIEKTVAAGGVHDVIIHLFTDGQDNDRSGKIRFPHNVERIAGLRQKAGVTVELYYHGLGVKPDSVTDSLIKQTEGIHFVDGITVAPRARFTPSTTSPTDVTPVTFVNNSSGVADHWRWEFGDGAVSTERSPTHTFKDPGTFTVRLTASNRGGAHAATTRITVEGERPKARFAVADPEKPKHVGAPVRFLNQTEGRVAAYAWDFGDGQGKSTDRNPEYAYKQAGTFEVVLVATGPFGKDQATAFVKVSQEPVVAFSYFPAPPKHGQEVKFSNDSVGEYKAWAWDFGDGAQSQEASPTHIYAKPGNYTAALSGNPVEGDMRRIQKTVTVVSADHPPIAIMAADERIRQGEVSVGVALSFHSISSGTVARCEWDFGDGADATGDAVKHAYRQAGTFKVALKAIGPLGEDETRVSVTVAEPDWQIAVSPTPVALGREATVALENAPPHVAGVAWDFGDGTDPEPQVRGALARHTFKSEGKYAVQATITLQDGAESVQIERILHAEVSVLGEEVMVRFEASADRASLLAGTDGARKLRGPVPMTVRFEDRSTGPVAIRAWDFGDGGKSDDRSPSHVYRVPGGYRARLTVIDHFGRSHASTASESLAIETIGWRPTREWRWPGAIFFYFIVALFWCFLPWHLRRVAYEVDEGKRRHRSWTRNLALRNEDMAVTLRLGLTLLLRKFYTPVTKGAVQWTNAKGERPNRKRLQARDQLTLGDKTYTVRNLNNSASTAMRSLLIILILTALAVWWTWPLFF